MMTPRLCSACHGIRTVHGVIAGLANCAACQAYYHHLKAKQASFPAASSSEEGGIASELCGDSGSGGIGNHRAVVTNIFPDDVLLGRGKFANDRQGNRFYRGLLEEHCEAYAQCTTQAAKTQFTMRIVQRVKHFGRFLKPVGNNSTFVEISDSKARVKVGQVSRENRDGTMY